MNKKLVILVISVFCLVLTGCGAKEEKLDCTLEKDNVTIGYKATLKGNEVLDFTYSEKMVLANENLAKQTYTQLEQTFAIFDAFEGVTTENELDGNVVTSSMTIDYEKLTEDGKKNLSFDFETAEELKEIIEKDKYVCK